MTTRWPRAFLRRSAGSCSIAMIGRCARPPALPSSSTLKFGITGIVVIQPWAISVLCSLNGGCFQQPKLRVYETEESAQRSHREIQCPAIALHELLRSQRLHIGWTEKSNIGHYLSPQGFDLEGFRHTINT